MGYLKIDDHIHAFIWESMTANNCNSYLIDGPTPILIDPGHINCFEHVENGLAHLGLDIKDIGLIISTHAHPDHLEAVRLFEDKPVKTAMHQEEWEFIKSMEKHLHAAMGTSADDMEPDILLVEGDLAVEGTTFNVFHTPGHSPGSVSLLLPDCKAMFTGDLIFRDGLGRTDLPGGDGSKLKESIQRLSKLDIKYLLPGHGNIIGDEEGVKKNFDQVENSWFAHI